MDDFESKLKRLPVCKPSVGLRERIFGQRPARVRPRGTFTRRIPVGWAALLALSTGLAGFSIARVWEGEGRSPLASETGTVQVKVIYEAPASRHVFDFTEASPAFLTGDVDLRVEPARRL